VSWRGDVSQVLGGADLFLAGLIVPAAGLEPWAAGDAMCVRIPQHAFPFAVGVMECSSAAAVQGGMKGRGLKLLHTYPDLLWALGDKSAPDGFTPSRIFPQATPPPPK
jgi:translation initiation factor 2D